MDGAAFCPFCGAQMGPSVRQEPPAVAQTLPWGTGGPAAPAPMGYAGAFPAQTPLSRAWRDWNTSVGKWGIVLKMALFQLLPGVGGLVLDGYALSWGRDCALGRREPMDPKLIRPGVLDTGLYVYGVGVIVGIVAALAAALLFALLAVLGVPTGWISLLIFLAATAFSPVFAVMRMVAALCGRVRDGLSVSRAWQMVRSQGKAGTLLTSVWIPAAAASGLAFLLYLVWAAIFIAGVLGSVSSSSLLMSLSSARYASALVGSLITMLLTLVPLLFCIFFVSVSAQLVTARAVGYWISDFRPDAWPEYRQNAAYQASRAL